MSALAFTRRLPSVAAPVRVLALLAAALVIALISGRVAVSSYGAPAISALIGIPLMIYLFPRPLLGCLLMVALLSFAGYGKLPRVPLPGHPPLSFADILLVVLVGGTLWRRPWRSWPRDARRFAGLLLVLVAVAAVPTLRLFFHGHDPARQAILGYKNFLYLAVAITIAVELSGRQWRLLLGAAICLAVFVSLVSILAAASGGVASFLDKFDAGSVQQASEITQGPARIRLPGLFFVYGMVVPTLAMGLVFRDRWRLWRLLSLIPMLAAIALSLNRNMYLGGIVGLAVALLIGGPPLRHRFLIGVMVAAVSLIIVVETAVLPSAAAPIERRAQTVLSSQVLKTSSLQDRADEFAHAIRSIRHHPWVGVGWFQNYGAYSNEFGAIVARLGVEDLYLHLATDLGIPVLIAFLVVCGALLVTAVRRARKMLDPARRALLASGIGALVALLMSCLVGAYLQDVGTSMMFGVTCGFVLGCVTGDGSAASPSRPAAATGAA